MEEWQTVGRKEMRAGRILLIGILLIVLAISSSILSHFFRLWEDWKLAMLVTMLGVIFAVIAVPVLIFGLTLKAKE